MGTETATISTTKPEDQNDILCSGKRRSRWRLLALCVPASVVAACGSTATTRPRRSGRRGLSWREQQFERRRQHQHLGVVRGHGVQRGDPGAVDPLRRPAHRRASAGAARWLGQHEQVSSQSDAFTGTISGNSVTLSLNQGLGSVTDLTGTLDGQQLDLNYPGQDGAVITIQMAPGGPSDFNADLSNLQSQAGQARNQAAQQQAAQQQANSVASDAQAVSNDLSTLQTSEHDATGTGSVAGDLAQMRKDLGQTQTDLQHVLGEAGHTDVDTLCTDADTVSSDDDTVSGDYDTISGDQDSSDGDTGDINRDQGAPARPAGARRRPQLGPRGCARGRPDRRADQPGDQGRAGADQRRERHHGQRPSQAKTMMNTANRIATRRWRHARRPAAASRSFRRRNRGGRKAVHGPLLARPELVMPLGRRGASNPCTGEMMNALVPADGVITSPTVGSGHSALRVGTRPRVSRSDCSPTWPRRGPADPAQLLEVSAM